MSSRLRKLSSHSIAALLGGAVTSLSLTHNMNIDEDYSKVIHGVLNSFMNDLDHISNNNDNNDNGSKKRHQEEVQQQKNSTRQEHDQQGKKSSSSYTNSSSQMNNSHSNRSSRKSDDTMPFIQSPISIFQPNPNLQIAYDARTKNPLYVMERLCYRNNTKTARNNNSNSNDNNKRFQFYEPKSLPPQHRTRNGYYRKSGFDRGHIAPAADFTYDDGYKMDTFSLMNISPQYPTFNRVVWLHLENWVRKLQTRRRTGRSRVHERRHEHDPKFDFEKDIFVISGPLWLPTSSISMNSIIKNNSKKERRELFQYSYYGFGSPPSLIQVPTHFFKVIFTLHDNTKDSSDDDSDYDQVVDQVVDQFAAFVIPNEPFENENKGEDSDKNNMKGNNDSMAMMNKKSSCTKSIHLIDCIVQLSDLEAVTGISFFPTENNRSPSSRSSKISGDGDEIENNGSSIKIFDLITELVVYEKNEDNDNNVSRIIGTGIGDSSTKDGIHTNKSRIVSYSNGGNSGSNNTNTKKKRVKMIKKKLNEMVIQNKNKKKNNNNKNGSSSITVLPKHICSGKGNNICNEFLYQSHQVGR